MHESFLYRKSRVSRSSGAIAWRCTRQSCGATLKTSPKMKTVIEKKGNHDHPPTDGETPSAVSSLTARTVLPTGFGSPCTPLSSAGGLVGSSSAIFGSVESVTDAEVACDHSTSPSSLTSFLAEHNIFLTPTPPKFADLKRENEFIRARLLELEHMKVSLVDRSMQLEGRVMELEQLAPQTGPLRLDAETQTPPEWRVSSGSEKQIKQMLTSISVLEADNLALRNELPDITPASQKLPSNFNVQLRNFYKPLQFDDETIEGNISEMDDELATSKCKRPNKNKKRQNKKQLTPVQEKTNTPVLMLNKNKKILLCSDSHGRNLAWHLNNKLKSHECIGFVKPGARTEQVLNRDNILREIENENDILVILCGTNDVAKNEAEKALLGIEEMVKQLQKNKIILIDLPTRYDLVEWSCVNEEVRQTNESLKVLSGQYDNVVLVEAGQAKRYHHTRHGMHLNHRGKGWLAERICEALEDGDTVELGSIVSLIGGASPQRVSPVVNQTSLPRSQVDLLGSSLSPVAQHRSPGSVTSLDREGQNTEVDVNFRTAASLSTSMSGNEFHTMELTQT